LSKTDLVQSQEKKKKMDPAAILDHEFRVAAYVVTWVIQLGYLSMLILKWWSQKRAAKG
jgi:hypothetical protein